MSELPDSKPRNQCRNGLAMYLALTILLSAGFGYSLCSWHSRSAFVELSDQQVRERAAIVREHRAEKKYLRNQLEERNATVARQSDQLALCSSKAVDGAKSAIQLIDKQTPKAGAK